jgi:hypothetical protein
MLTNTTEKRRLIDEQQKSLMRESELKKQKQSVYEDFDEDESRHAHDLAWKESIVEHYNSFNELMPLQKSRNDLESAKLMPLQKSRNDLESAKLMHLQKSRNDLESTKTIKLPKVNITYNFFCYSIIFLIYM